jgi:hypothetical protein
MEQKKFRFTDILGDERSPGTNLIPEPRFHCILILMESARYSCQFFFYETRILLLHFRKILKYQI